eukprot:TRINITY_DN14776_c0_g1_i1.p1 TRINITY_DN14776_c0_g1~~TRINITY_DN14776_c0_g1_i1.p1  ORF type:complete len:365 (-),score=91.45 TRINITY_DN14776_c0_g1_i1:130-1224(-)
MAIVARACVFFAIVARRSLADEAAASTSSPPVSSDAAAAGFPTDDVLDPGHLEAALPDVGIPISPIMGTTQKPFLNSEGELFQPEGGPDANRLKGEQMADCVINSIQAAEFLAVAALTIKSATNSCPADQKARNLCAADVSGVVAAFSAIASFLSSAASSCGAISNAAAGCAASITGLVDSVAELVQASNSLANNCVAAATHVKSGAQRRLTHSRPTLPAVDVAWCVIDVTNAMTWLGKAGLQISVATETCAGDQEVCAANVMGVLGSFVTAASCLAPTASMCQQGMHSDALCAADLTQLIANLNNVAQASISAKLSCNPHALHPDVVLGARRRLRGALDAAGFAANASSFAAAAGAGEQVSLV